MSYSAEFGMNRRDPEFQAGLKFARDRIFARMAEYALGKHQVVEVRDSHERARALGEALDIVDSLRESLFTPTVLSISDLRRLSNSEYRQSLKIESIKEGYRLGVLGNQEELK